MVAAARPVTSLIEEIRQRTDHVNSNFVTNAELEGWINQSASDLHDLIVEYAGSEAFLDSETIATVAGVETYELASDFYRLVGVDARFGGRWRSLKPYTPAERNRFEGMGAGWTGPRDVRYALAGRSSAGVQNLRFIPAPPSVTSVRVWFIPLAFESVVPASLVSFNGWDEYVICDVAAKVREKKEGDPRPFLTRRDRAAARIVSAAKKLDMGAAPRMRDALEEAAESDFERLRYD